MTFNTFNQILTDHIPTAHAVMHGKFGGTEKNKKVSISFTENGKVFEYYGAYEDILTKIGILTISKDRFECLTSRLARLECENGTEDEFFGLGTFNYDKEISDLKTEIKNYEDNYLII